MHGPMPNSLQLQVTQCLGPRPVVILHRLPVLQRAGRPAGDPVRRMADAPTGGGAVERGNCRCTPGIRFNHFPMPHKVCWA
jgi:hypothetical protein